MKAEKVMTRIVVPLLIALAVSPAAARAQTTVDQRRPAAPDGVVEIENGSGTVHVVGWDKPEIQVSGSLGRRASGLEFSGGPHKTRIEVGVEGNPNSVKSDLEVHVPAGSRLAVEGFAATIRIEGVNGPVRAETVNGSIAMTGGSKEVDLQSVNGSVEVTSPATRVHAESVNGAVTIKDASGEVEASTVNGKLTVIGGSFQRGRLESVSGDVYFEGALSGKATLSAETVSGCVELALPGSVSADFSISTFSGDITNDLGPAPVKKSRWTSEKDLSFTTGSGGADVSVQTLSGCIHLRKR
jgi:DUF4097 and DUF4098 domain-containing protein YvlB